MPLSRSPRAARRVLFVGADRTRGNSEGPYACWDVDGQNVLALFDRAAMAIALRDGGDRIMLVSRVTDVDSAYAACLSRGATAAAPPTDRPEWGPTMRSAHVRDPEGNLREVQSYQGLSRNPRRVSARRQMRCIARRRVVLILGVFGRSRQRGEVP
ncbi:VOC family protein [Streptomyces sp. NPDC046161]|uniref:VOC family protein n=1 Tax=Streptomyces sp. NPDC046161 TaxID=3155132 RepID=UPI0034044510